MLPSLSRKPALLGIVAAVLSAGVAVALWLHQPGSDSHENGQPGFRECARESGITFQMCFLPGEQGEHFKTNLYDHGCGVAVGDFDGDGHDDVFFCNQLGKCALYRNKGDGTFEDVTTKAGVGLGDRVCVGATFADYDNDGWQDLFVTSTRGGNVLFHNNRDGTFTNVTLEAKVEYVGHSQTAAFFDFDNDGWLDLLVTNSGKWTTDSPGEKQVYYPGVAFAVDWSVVGRKEYNILYRNRGDGTFEDVTDKVGLKGKGWAGDVAVLDYDGDGWLDLLITCMFGRSQLYHNNGNGTFTDVTGEALGRTPYGALGARAFDFDNDGRLDIYIVDMHSDMWTDLDYEHKTLGLARLREKKKSRYLGYPTDDPNPSAEQAERARSQVAGYNPAEVFYGNALYRNLGGGKFEEVSDKAGMETFWPWSIATGDFDNDGFEDVFIAAGMGYPFYHWPNSLMMNNGDGTFTDRARAWGIEPPPRGIHLDEMIGGRMCVRSSRCCASADFDGDGRLDLVVNNFNDHPYYFRNEFPRKNYIAFRLRGTKSNRDAVGAVVRLYAGKEVMTRQVNPAGGYLSQSSKTLHFGLGDRTGIDRVEIRWPGGARQVIEGPQVNTLHPLTEPRQ
jgi:enediyne biosynthesis protein E4